MNTSNPEHFNEEPKNRSGQHAVEKEGPEPHVKYSKDNGK